MTQNGTLKFDLTNKSGREYAMNFALNLAKENTPSGDIPIAAMVISKTGEMISSETNKSEKLKNPCAHAEILAIESACSKLQQKNLETFSIVTTLEPCTMCAGAILQSHISQVIFGAWDEKFGACGSNLDILREPGANSHPEVYAGLLESDCSELISDFFCQLRNPRNNSVSNSGI